MSIRLISYGDKNFLTHHSEQVVESWQEAYRIIQELVETGLMVCVNHTDFDSSPTRGNIDGK